MPGIRFEPQLLAAAAPGRATGEVVPRARQTRDIEVLFVEDEITDQTGVGVDAGANLQSAGHGFRRGDIQIDRRVGVGGKTDSRHRPVAAGSAIAALRPAARARKPAVGPRPVCNTVAALVQLPAELRLVRSSAVDSRVHKRAGLVDIERSMAAAPTRPGYRNGRRCGSTTAAAEHPELNNWALNCPMERPKPNLPTGRLRSSNQSNRNWKTVMPSERRIPNLALEASLL